MTEAALSQPLAPVAARDRVASLDLIRGFAVLGILAVNAMTFFWPHAVSTLPALQPGWDGDAAAGWQIMDVFFRDKMRTLFSMLFGASIFLVGGERSDTARGRLLRSRLFWLAVFGVVHGAAFWYGDILLLYACTGFVVLLARSWPAKRLLIVGGLLCLVLSLLYVGLYGAMNFAPIQHVNATAAQQGWGTTPERLAQQVAVFHGDALSVTLSQLRGWLSVGPAVVIAFLPMTASLMLIGMGLFKSGYLSGRAPTWLYAVMTGIGAAALGLIWFETGGILEGGFDFLPTITRPAATVLVPLVSIAYASGLILLLKAGARMLLHPLMAVGRMAFTNYLTQTLIMTFLAYGGRGLGLYGEIGWPEMWGVIGGVWAAQLIWSPVWLHFFRMGPIEWAWRRLTYGRPIQLAKDAA